MSHLLQCLGYLIHIRLVLRLIPHVGIRSGNIKLAVFDGRRLGRETVAGSRSRQLRQCSDVPGMQFTDLDRLIALQYIYFTNLLFNITIHVIQQIIRFQYSGVYLDQGVFSNERIHDGFPDVSGFSLCEVIIRMVDLVGLQIDTRYFSILRARHVFDNII